MIDFIENIDSKTIRKYNIEDSKIKKVPICNCGNEMAPGSNMCFSCKKIKSRKVDRPNIDVLLRDIEELGYSATGRKYGVSDNSIRKWIKK